jgi:hypothetical protein
MRHCRRVDVAPGGRRAGNLAAFEIKYTFGVDPLQQYLVGNLTGGVTRHPADRDILSALVSFNRAAGDTVAALEYAEQLAAVMPHNPGLAALIGELRSQVNRN